MVFNKFQLLLLYILEIHSNKILNCLFSGESFTYKVLQKYYKSLLGNLEKNWRQEKNIIWKHRKIL